MKLINRRRVIYFINIVYLIDKEENAKRKKEERRLIKLFYT